MTQESLHELHINDLLDLMVKSVNELLVLDRVPENKLTIKAKMNEVELIQKVIALRRAQLPPR
jgi:hypothetical protein